MANVTYGNEDAKWILQVSKYILKDVKFIDNDTEKQIDAYTYILNRCTDSWHNKTLKKFCL